MSNKSGVFLLVIALAAGGYYYYHTQLSASFLKQEKVKFNGEEQSVRSRESVERCGLKLRMIANKDNAAILYCKASNDWDAPKGHVRDAVYKRDVTDRAVKRWMERNKECLALLHKAARKKDCQFPVLGKEDEALAETLLPHAAAMKYFAWLLVSEGTRYERHGDSAKALDCYLTTHAFAHHLDRSDAYLVCKLVSVACFGIGNMPVEECLANRRLSEAELRMVVRHYASYLDKCPDLGEAVTAEKAMCRDMITRFVSNPDDLSSFLLVMPEPLPPERIAALKQAACARGYNHLRELDGFMEAMKRWYDLPTWQALQPSWSWDAYIKRSPPRSPLVAFLLLPGDKARKAFAELEATNGGILIFAAIKLYEKKNGRPPQSLAELKGDYVSTLPKDPFSGRDYVYKVRGSNWLLYSVGDNLVDDGGAGFWPHDRSEDKDIIWRNTRIVTR